MKRFKIDLSGELKDVTNKPMATSLEDPTSMKLSLVMQDALAKCQSETPLKTWTWAMDLTASPFLLVDQHDKNKLREVVSKFAMLDFAKAQLLLAIDGATEATDG